MIVCSGRAIAAKRTARRFSRVGSSGQACAISATEVKAIVQRPWMMIPGRPTDFANCVVEMDLHRVAGGLRVAEGLVGVEGLGDLGVGLALAQRLVEAVRRRVLADVLQRPGRRGRRSSCTARRPSSPSASRVSARVTTVTPEERWRMPIGAAVVLSFIPGSIGRW